jgi:hypothetical protein
MLPGMIVHVVNNGEVDSSTIDVVQTLRRQVGFGARGKWNPAYMESLQRYYLAHWQ